DGQELCIETVGHQTCKRRLAHPRRPPEDHGMRPARLKRNPQWLAGPQQVSLAHDLGQRPGPHALGKRSTGKGIGGVGKQIFRACHEGRYILTTSTPAGGVKENSSALTDGFDTILFRSIRVVCPKESSSSSRAGMPP